MAANNNNNAHSAEEAQTSRGAHAKRFGKIGLLLGAVAGLLSGGGVPAIMQFALLGAGASALGGAFAGDKLAPVADKVFGMLPGRKKAAQKAEQAQQVEIEQALQAPQQEVKFRVVDSQEAEKSAAPSPEFRSIDELDAGVLDKARSDAGQSMRQAREGMDPSAAPMSQQGQAKRATHSGPAMMQ